MAPNSLQYLLYLLLHHRSDSFKYLGVVINQTMSWSEHIDSISTKINQRIGMIKRIRHLLPLHAKLTLYNCLIIPLFDYGDTVWGDKNNDTLMGQLQVLQNKAAKVLLNLPPRSSSTEALDRLDLKTLSKRRHFHRCAMMHKYLSGKLILILTSDAIVVFILIKLAEAMIYTFLACVPTGANKLSFIKPLRTGTT